MAAVYAGFPGLCNLWQCRGGAENGDFRQFRPNPGLTWQANWATISQNRRGCTAAALENRPASLGWSYYNRCRKPDR